MRLLIVILQISFFFRNNPAWKSLLIVKSKSLSRFSLCNFPCFCVFSPNVVLRTALFLSSVNSVAEYGC
jgi:hypothetical protein